MWRDVKQLVVVELVLAQVVSIVLCERELLGVKRDVSLFDEGAKSVVVLGEEV